MKQALTIFAGTVLLLVGLVILSSGTESDAGLENTNREEAAASATATNTILETSDKRARLAVAERCLDLGVADTSQLRAQGLSGQPNITDSQGLLFVYEESGDYGFWMKEMNFPIDIIWLDRDFEVITIKENAQPESYPSSFYPERRARYVLEIAAGGAEDLGIAPGDTLDISPPTTEGKSCEDLQ